MVSGDAGGADGTLGSDDADAVGCAGWVAGGSGLGAVSTFSLVVVRGTSFFG